MAVNTLVKRLVGVFAALCLVTSLGLTPAGADTTPPTNAADAKTQLDKLQKELDALDREYAQVQDRVHTIASAIDARNSEISKKQKEVDASKQRLGRVALTQFQNRNSMPVSQLLVAVDNEQSMSSLSVLDKMSSDQTTLLQRYQSDMATLNEVKRQYEHDLAAAKADQERLSELDAKAKAKVAEMKKQYDKLTAEEAAAFKKEQEAKAAQEKKPAIPSLQTELPAMTGKPPAAATGLPPSDGTYKTEKDFPRPTPWNAPSVPITFTSTNNYAWGNCTWYTHARRAALGNPVGASFGNGAEWGVSAASRGLPVGNTPRVGAVVVTYQDYYGHVAVVEWVNPDGSYIVSEMNNSFYAGLGWINFRLVKNPYGTYIY